MAEYRKAHKDMLNRDFGGGRGQRLRRSRRSCSRRSSSVGEIDRKKIRDVIAGGKFQTVWGELNYVDQRNANPWAVGQWQNGEIVGLFPANKAGAKPLLFPKPAWS